MIFFHPFTRDMQMTESSHSDVSELFECFFHLTVQMTRRLTPLYADVTWPIVAELFLFYASFVFTCLQRHGSILMVLRF